MQQSPYAPPREAAPSDVPRQQRGARPPAVRLLSATSLAAAALFVLWAIQLASGLSIFLVVILGLIASPYLVLWLACRSLTGWSGMILVAMALVGCIWVGIAAFDAVDEDAQGGLNLVFVPIFQLGGVLVSMCLAVALDWLERRVRGAL